MGLGDILESLFGDMFGEPEWMEKETPYWGLRIWHFGFFALTGLLSLSKFQILQHFFKLFVFFKFVLMTKSLFLSISSVIMLCCCFRFRIPRTKQEIEADYQRRIIAKKFRERLAQINNCEMDDMNLQKGTKNAFELSKLPFSIINSNFG